MFKRLSFLIVALLLVSCGKKQETPKIVLTAPQQMIVDAGVPIKVCHSSTGRPIQWTDDGEPAGISIDTLKLVAERTSLRLEFMPLANQAAAVDAFKAKKCDILAAVKPLPERNEFMNYTQPYLVMGSTMLVQELPIQFPMRVGFGRKYSIQPTLEYLAKQVTVVPFDNDEESFKALLDHRIDALVADELSAFMLEHKYNRKFAHSAVNFQYDISIGYQKGSNTLGTLLSLGLSSITPAEKAEIMSRNVDY
jgi:ABC-type amino acid transport substrate-binding protein